MKTKYLIYILPALIVIFFIFALANNKHETMQNSITATSAPEIKGSTATTSEASLFVMPISDAKDRITKKHFGIKVSPGNSPVSPERFTGIHTGVDFETFPSEQDTDVPVVAICPGKLLVAEFGSGYGGMMVESCTLNGSPITVVYGHVRLSSIKAKVGDTISAGEFLANLGTGYSKETDGERKHLHLGIHKGASVNTKGYVANYSDLSGWIDFEKYLN